jgi:hypothetical protein
VLISIISIPLSGLSKMLQLSSPQVKGLLMQ